MFGVVATHAHWFQCAFRMEPPRGPRDAQASVDVVPRLAWRSDRQLVHKSAVWHASLHSESLEDPPCSIPALIRRFPAVQRGWAAWNAAAAAHHSIKRQPRFDDPLRTQRIAEKEHSESIFFLLHVS